jgi:hypothetical protein
MSTRAFVRTAAAALCLISASAGLMAADRVRFEKTEGATYIAHASGYDALLQSDATAYVGSTGIQLQGASSGPEIDAGTSRIRYLDVYPGIDVEYHSHQGALEFDYIVSPYADPGQIVFAVKGAASVTPGPDGDLLASSANGVVRLAVPAIYQLGPSATRSAIPGGYVTEGAKVRFKIGAYDRSRPLIIDPVLTYSTFVGNSGDSVMATAADSSGNAYLVGRSSGLILAQKVSPDGTTVLLRQTIGASSYSFSVQAVAIGSNGELYLAGDAGVGLPTTAGAYIGSVTGGSHAFVAVLDSSFNLLYCSYLAGTTSAFDEANGVAADSAGNAYITGYTNSTTFPTTAGVFQTTPSTSGQTGFVAKFNPSASGGASLVYSTYLTGPTSATTLLSIAVDSSHNAYVTGTAGADFPVTAGTFQYDGVGLGSGGVYVTKLNSTATAVTYSAYLGNGQANAITLDTSGDAYITGNATISDFPTTSGAYQVSYPGAFVTELNTTGTSLIYSTFLSGPSENATAMSIALVPGCASACAAYIAGFTSATDFPAINAIQGFNASGSGGNDLFVTELSGNGTAAASSTYLGGSNDESNQSLPHIPGIGVMSTGDAIVGGETSSTDFPVTLTTTPSRPIFSARIGSAAGSQPVAFPLSLNFSNQPISVPRASQNINLRNMGSSALAISSIAAAGDYSQTNTCGSSLAGGAECAIGVTFTPTVTGTRTGTVIINGTLTINLSGTGANGSYMTVTPASLTFGSTMVGSAAASQNVTIGNVGNQALTLNANPFSVNGDFAETSNCPASLAVNTTCTLTVSFLPTQEGQRTGSISISSNSSSQFSSVNLTGTGGAGNATLTLEASGLVFNPQSLTIVSTAQSLAVANTGNVPVTIFSAIASGDFVATGCVQSLNPGATCSVRVSFTPTAAGTRTGTVTIVDSTPASPHSFTLTGTGVATTETIGITPAAVVFPDEPVGQTSKTISIVVTNVGTLPVTVDRVVESGDYRVTSNGCTTLAFRTPPATCNISVAFTPTTTGARTGAITLTDNATGSPQTVTLSGNGLAVGATATLSPNNMSFGTQPIGLQSFTQTATITNTGNVPINLTSATITGTNSGDFSQTNFFIPSLLSPDRTCQFTVSFTPTATGSRSATLSVVDDAGTQTVALTGTGETATFAASFAPASMTFEAQATGTTSPNQGLVLVNSGDDPLVIGNIVVSGNYSLPSNPCVTTIQPNASCTLQVAFSPTGATGTQTGTVTFTDNAGAGSQIVNLTGQNVAAAPAIKVGPAGLAFLPTAVGTTTNPQTVTITNTTAATVTGLLIGTPTTADYAVVNNGCGASLSSNGSCNFGVTFDPTTAGTRSATILIGNSAANQTLTLGGFGLAATLSAFVRDPGLVFPDQVIGTTSSGLNITYQNNGNIPVTIASVVISTGDFAILNNCSVTPNTISPNQTCTVTVTFTPTAAGNRTATVTFTDNAPGSPRTIAISGKGLTSTQGLEVDRTTMVFPTQSVGQAANQPNPQSFTLTNTGNSPVTISSIASSNADFALSNSCPVSPATLPPGPSGNTCQVSVTFTPSKAITDKSTITISSSASGTALKVSASGIGVTDTKTVVVTPVSVAFIPQVVGTTSGFTQTVVVNNEGNEPVSISSVTVSTTYSLSNGCNGVTLLPATNCSISIAFTPTSAKTVAGTLTIKTTGTPATATVGLTGTGIAASTQISLSQTNVVFDQQVVGVASQPQTIYYYNQGNSTVNLTSVVPTGADFSMTNGCSTSVSALSSCNIKVTFKPTTTGLRTGTIVITDSAPGSPRTINLSGTGVSAAAPGVTLSPASLTFASQALGTASPAQNINVTNSGESNLTIAGVTLTGADPQDYNQTNNCPATLIPSFSCNIAVTFKPTATGARTASVNVADNASGSPQTVSLTGTGAPGTTPLVTFTPPSLGFTNVALNSTSASQTSTLQNTGAAALTITKIAASGTVPGDFAQTNNCPASVPVNGTCTITVTFTPTATLNQTGAVTVTDNTPNGSDILALTGNGVAPEVNLSATTLAFGNQTHGTTSAAKTVTVENSGSATLTFSSVTATKDYNIVNNTCAGSLAPGLTCTFGVTFSPTITGTDNGYVMVTDNAGDSPQFITLTGSGT